MSDYCYDIGEAYEEGYTDGSLAVTEEIKDRFINMTCDKFAELIREDFNITLDVVMETRKELLRG